MGTQLTHSRRTNFFGLLLVGAFVSASMATVGPSFVHAQGPTVTVLTPEAEMAYDGEEQIPSGYRLEHRPHWWALISGLAAFGVSYGLSVAIAVAAEDGRMAIPVVGPIVVVAEAESCSGPFAGFCAIGWAMLIVDTIIQAAGLTLTTIGLVGKDLLVLDEGPSARLELVPSAPNADLGGLSLSATW